MDQTTVEFSPRFNHYILLKNFVPIIFFFTHLK